ncbi:hypothetical protein [Roseomonas sp. USHLN139]|uniref:hypothetical protein n=1 Tax=Roseomonas sp. USHLN139 TaxID=3081298 RepID=UPI003B02652D
MGIAEGLQRRLERDGEPVTLRRAVAPPAAPPADQPKRWQDWGWGGGSAAEVECSGLISTGTPVQLVGEVWQVRRQVILGQAEIDEAGWPGPPRRGDQLEMADGSTHAVDACDTRRIAGIPVRHTLTVLGDR